MTVLGHYVGTNFGEIDCGKEEGFKAAYVFFFFMNRGYVCVSSSKAKDEFKRKTFPRSQCQGRIFHHCGVRLRVCLCECTNKYLGVGGWVCK